MTDTPQDAAVAEPQAPEALRIIKASTPQVLSALLTYSAPAHKALDAALVAFRDANPDAPYHEILNGAHHLGAIEEWCRANTKTAALVVLCAVYLSNGAHFVQEVAPADESPTPEAEAPPQDAEGSGAGPG